MRRRSPLLALVGVGVLSAAVSSQATEGFGEGRARARLVASGHAVADGPAVMLGVRFDVEPGWHIYWRYPGGAGLATEVQWKLPAGLEAGELRWPLPVSFTQSEGIPGYGYEGSVVLAAELEAGPGLDPSTAVVGAEVSWLACRERCVLGGASLEAKLGGLPVDPGFASWRSLLPRPLEGGDAPFTVTTTGGLDAEKISLWLRWRAAPGDATWFPDPTGGLEVGEVTVQTRGGLTRVDAPLRRRTGAVPPRALESLIVVDGADGVRRGWEYTIDLEP